MIVRSWGYSTDSDSGAYAVRSVNEAGNGVCGGCLS